MKPLVYLLATVVLLLGTPLYAHEETTEIIVKEASEATGPLEVLISVYDQPQGGTVLYQTTQTVEVSEGQFVEILSVPTALWAEHPQVFIAFAQATDPPVPLGDERMQFTHPSARMTDHGLVPQGASPTAAAAAVYGAAVCYTCGGAFPFQTGAIATRIGGTNIERGPGCAGPLRRVTNDSRPFLCYNYF